MVKRQAPYKHPDGSNCWTKNCRLAKPNTAFSSKETFLVEMFEQNKQKLVVPEKKDNGIAHISFIASQEEFDAAVRRGEISRSRHPEYPYSIYKYTMITTYTKNWFPITLASRGLVVDDETGEIVVRPFPKFFNYSEGLTDENKLKGEFRVADKLDGSLGLLYRNPDGKYEITTAGGFQSEQGAHATKLYQEKYDGLWNPRSDVSYHFEIIYPQNRIVVDYGGEDDIYLLGAVHKRTGRSIPLDQIQEWKWKRAQEFNNFSSLKEVTEAPDPGISHEGYVVHFVETDTRVKFKFSEYLQVHKIATGINSRRIHEELKTGGSNLQNFMMNAPEEFKEYIEKESVKLTNQFNERRSVILDTYKRLVSSLPANVDRKTFAVTAQRQVERSFLPHMFNLFDGREPIKDLIWDSIQPPFEKTFFANNVPKNDI